MLFAIALLEACMKGGAAREQHCKHAEHDPAAFCATGYEIPVALDQKATDAIAFSQYSSYSGLARDDSCKHIYKEYLCAHFHPGCLEEEDGKTVESCREACVYSKLCGFPVNDDCGALNTIHPLEWMVRGKASQWNHCLSSGGGTYSAHYLDKDQYQLHNIRVGNYRSWPFMPTVAQYTYLHGVGKHSLGLAGVDNFSWADRMFLDFVLTNHPEFIHLTELGTYHGDTSLLLGTIARSVPAGPRGSWVRMRGSTLARPPARSPFASAPLTARPLWFRWLEREEVRSPHSTSRTFAGRRSNVRGYRR